MKIEKFVIGDIESNCYVLYQEDGGLCTIVDPGGSAEKICAYIKAHRLTPERILLTHHHHDHVDGIAGIRREFDVPVFIHEEELWRLSFEAEGMKDGDVFGVGGESLMVIHTPGHSEGSVCFFCPEMKIAFTGDCVFSDETGYTIFDGGSKWAMIRSIGGIINGWDDDVVIYPGHFGTADMAYVKANNTDYIKAMKRYTKEYTEKQI